MQALWEYTRESVGETNFFDRMKFLGASGWELVWCHKYEAVDGEEFFDMILKKQFTTPERQLAPWPDDPEVIASRKRMR